MKYSMQGKNQNYILEQNRSSVLYNLWSLKNTSRKVLATVTGLTPTTLSNIIGDLIEEGWVKEVGTTKTPRGRGSIAVEIDPDFRNVIGIRLARNYVSVGMFNLAGKMLFHDKTDLTPDLSPGNVIQIMTNLIEKSMDKTNDKRMIAAIGIGVPGPLSTTKGKINFISNFPGWTDIPIEKMLRTKFDLPIILNHDANAAALSEKWFGAAKDAQNLLYIAAGRGVGAGFVINGKLYQGATGSAGEIGHVTIDYKGPLCECGNHGCLEMYCSSTVLLDKCNQLAESGKVSFKKNDSQKLMIDDLARLASQGERTVNDLIVESAELLAFGLAGLVNVLNPDVIVLGDEMSRLGDVWVNAVKRFLLARILPDFRDQVQIIKSSIQEDPFLIGSGVLAIEYLFRNPMIISKQASLKR